MVEMEDEFDTRSKYGGDGCISCVTSCDEIWSQPMFSSNKNCSLPMKMDWMISKIGFHSFDKKHIKYALKRLLNFLRVHEMIGWCFKSDVKLKET